MSGLDRIWVHPARALRRIVSHRTAAARVASDHLPVVADVDLEARPVDLSTPVAVEVASRPG